MTTLEFKAEDLAKRAKSELSKLWKHVTLQVYPQSFLVRYCCSKSKSYQAIEQKFRLACQYEQIEQVQPCE